MRTLPLALVVVVVAGCGTGTGSPKGPRVTSVVPADGATEVPLLPDIAITFSAEMDDATVTAALSGTACTGSVQLSGDGFATCVAFEDAPASDDGRTFLARPDAPLDALSSYALRVTRDARSAKDYRLDRAFDMDTGFETDDAPAVLETSPIDGAIAVDTTSLSVTFTRAMAPATITAQTANETCGGSLQVSRDDFATCVRMAAPPASTDDVTFHLTPMTELGSAERYRFRVDGDVTDAAGNPLGPVWQSPDGFLMRYFHTVGIDGANDFVTANERFDSSSAGYFGYLAWDRDTLFVGIEGADIGSGSATRFVLVYLGGTGGTTVGQNYNTQSPALPFDAKWHVRWRADNLLTDTQEWDGAMWATATWNASAFQSGNFVELAIPIAELGSPAMLPVHLSMINEAGGAEATFSVVPATSIAADGYDPDYDEFFVLDLEGSTVPSAHVAQ